MHSLTTLLQLMGGHRASLPSMSSFAVGAASKALQELGQAAHYTRAQHAPAGLRAARHGPPLASTGESPNRPQRSLPTLLKDTLLAEVAARSERRWKAILKECDADGDESLSRRELLVLLQRLKNGLLPLQRGLEPLKDTKLLRTPATESQSARRRQVLLQRLELAIPSDPDLDTLTRAVDRDENGLVGYPECIAIVAQLGLG